ncbi:MAG TPA: PTS sugar transporter subunit IIA [Victivallales bacterium]|nr:PTS sugar transporter subunit IIA [Victivallales bacterium]HPO89976.1 PTS sugar transporter subunit IIA [Victivallales bacterium]HRR05820.1 PTS sugar transporter subunit IIA [Victivallales bacterium]HRR28732.1 PTS sugar transporter subunit IIA [Victivallales bacterium]
MLNENPIKFQDYLTPENVICGLKSKESFGVISELSELISRNVAGLEKKTIENFLIEREKLFPTVIANGLAVPHARLTGLKKPVVAVGTSKEGINFNSEMPPVFVVFLVLSPKDDPSFHLQILSTLAKEFTKSKLLENLRTANSPTEIINLLGATISTHLPDFLTAADIMRKENIITLTESNTISDAIRIFSTEFIFDIPIIDEEKDIRGIISIEDILRISLPEHLLWMDDLTPIIRFQPFAELLRSEKEIKLADIMRPDFISIESNIPAIQVAKVFIMRKTRLIIVTDKGKLSGTIRIAEFVRKFFWE